MKTCNRLATACMLFLLNGGVLNAQSPTAKVDEIIHREMNERHIPGVQVAVVQHGKIVLSKAYGIANLQDSTPVTSQTIFSINSCTKSFTGVAIMQLVEEGKLALTDPISRYVDGLPALWQPITIKQLLTHISGIPDLNSLPKSDPPRSEDSSWMMVKALPMQFATGTQFSYNQTNYALLGKVIDKLRQQPFATVFREKQLAVAGMTHTGFADSHDPVPGKAPSYSYTNNIDGKVLEQPQHTVRREVFAPFARTASGMVSTAEDLVKWIIALQHGKLIKTKQALNTMWTAGSYNNGSPTQWALGCMTRPRLQHHDAITMTGGGRAAYIVYPNDDLAIVVLTNLGGGSPEDFIDELAGCYNPAVAAADPMTYLRIQLRKQGYDKAVAIYNEARKKDPAFKPGEYDMNDWGYRLLASGHGKESVSVFKLNVVLYPESWNVYDSYGEALMKTGQKEEAIKMYQRSVELNPDNKGGKRVLEQLLKETGKS
jgi:CubicO group peptidase (beta-lactamase class C family)